jgi:hypothetical protein
MEANTNLLDPRKSLFNWAGWCSFFITIVTFIATFTLCSINQHKELNYDLMGRCLSYAFYLSVAGLILGIISLFGIPKCGRRLILWKASIGILGSCGMGYSILMIAVAISLGHNC